MGPRGRGPDRGRGRGRGRGRNVEPPSVTDDELKSWFAGSLPDDWFSEPSTITFDRDEILITGTLEMPKLDKSSDDSVAANARIAGFREDTREQRIAIADRAQDNYLRKVSWAVACGDQEVAFTTASVPVMTRLVLEERAVLDTLIDAGVARSRSEALAWCVQLVHDNESEWIDKLRDAMEEVTELRNAGPASKK